MSELAPESKLFYEIFNLPKSFIIDKAQLKKSYYKISKQAHPDISNSIPLDSRFINKAFSVLNDDFTRAKLFTPPDEKISQDFLTHCLDLEEKIRDGVDLKETVLSKIEECKRNYKDPVWICKWGYYQRLLDSINGQSAS